MERFDRAALEEFGAAMFRAAGLSDEAAGVTTHLLVEADAMGHDTHGLALKREAAEKGVPLHPSILPALTPWAERYGVTLPTPLG